MRLRIFIIAMAAVFALSIGAMAQNSTTAPTGKTGVRAKAAGVKRMQLTDEQKQKIEARVKQYHADVKDIMKSTVSKDEKKSKIIALKEAAKADIMQVLTTQQQEQAKKTGFIDRMLGMRNGESGFMRALSQLGLTDQQNSDIKAVFAKSKDQAKAIRQDTSLDEASKKTNMEKLRKATHEQVMQVLTLEQKTKLQELLKNRPAPTK